MLSPIEVDDRWIGRWAKVWLDKYKKEGVVAADTWLNRFLAKQPILRRRVRIFIRKYYSRPQ